MKFSRPLSLSCFALLSACAQQRPPYLATTFYDMSESKFSVRAIAPADRIRELAICKAVWFAEKRKMRTISLSNPSYSSPNGKTVLAWKVPADWVMLTTTAYIAAPSPDGNQSFNVADKAPTCRAAWPWY